jgi:putative ABC transport system permease protein
MAPRCSHQISPSTIGLVDGETVEITVDSRRLPVTVRVANLPSYAILLTESDIRHLAPSIPSTQIWARLTDEANPGDTISAIQDALGGATGLRYRGGAEERASNNDVLNTLLWIVTTLLRVAIVISLVGVSNTLSLSVLERTRESAVLRAIGLTKRQLRVMLALEGVLLALVGAIIGIVLGTVYGFAGSLALIGGTWDVSYSAPVGRITVIILIAIAAGILASALPARNALKTSPVAALAE